MFCTNAYPDHYCLLSSGQYRNTCYVLNVKRTLISIFPEIMASNMKLVFVLYLSVFAITAANASKNIFYMSYLTLVF